MKANRNTSRSSPIQSAVVQRGTPLPQATLRRGIEALNQRVVTEHRARYAETLRADREAHRMMKPMIDMAGRDERVLQAVKNRRRLTLGRKIPKVTYPKPLQQVDPHVRAGSIMSIVGAPYDAEWVAESSSDQTTWGTGVAIKKAPEPRFNSTTNIGNGGSAWSSAGVGKWFVPAGRDSYVRVGMYAPYQYDWRLNSTYYTAHSSAFIGVYVQSFDLNGNNPRDELERRIPLWSQGTSWLQDHSDASDGYYPSDNYFWATNSRQYIAWAWCHTQADATSGSIAYSYAWATLSVSLPFMVFQEWT